MSDRKRALVTGIEGFSGPYVAQELRSAGFEVIGLTDRKVDDQHDLIHTDITDRAHVIRVIDTIKPHAVIHLAAISHVTHGDADAIYRVNVVGTRNLLDALVETAAPTQCVLLASSANIYGGDSGGVLDETTPPNPSNDYAVSKFAMELMARLWFDKLPIVIARPFNYTGVGQGENFLLPKIAGHYRRRADQIALGNLDVSRDFGDVRAVANAYRRLIEECPAGQTVNVATGRSFALSTILSMLESIAAFSVPVVVDPAFVRHHEVKSLCGDPSRLRGIIGEWDSPPLEETLRWMLEHTVD